jgi:prepilin-type processing-associated H-X9-DG protein
MLLIDITGGKMFSPVEPTPEDRGDLGDNRFIYDSDGDGEVDSDLHYESPGWTFNKARPKIHNNGCNVGLLDGHVERVSYRELWDVDENNEVTHPFWYPE